MCALNDFIFVACVLLNLCLCSTPRSGIYTSCSRRTKVAALSGGFGMARLNAAQCGSARLDKI